MFGKPITLFTMFGFPVRIDWSWLIILGLVIWSLAGGVFPAANKGLSQAAYLLMGLAGAFGLFASIVVHELSHSLVASRYGQPMKGITLFIFGGVAEMSDEPPSAKAEFWMAIAGPICSVVIAGLFLGASLIGQAVGWPAPVNAVLGWIGLINGILVVFNLIPGFPLDGGRVLRSALWAWKHDLRTATRIASQVGSGFGMALIALGFLSLLFGNPLGGLWWILIGMFLRSAARQGYQHVLVREALKGEPVSRFMNPDPVSVPPNLHVDDLVEQYMYRYHFKMFPVAHDGELDGCISTQEIKAVPRSQWHDKTVADLVTQCSMDNTIHPDEDAMNALSQMNRAQTSRLLVVEQNRLVGILSLKDLLKFLSMKLELEGEEEEAGVGATSGHPASGDRWRG